MEQAPEVVSIFDTLSSLRFAGNRTPESRDGELADAFAVLSQYRDGAIFVGHWAGTSEWERHPVGDEIVTVIEGQTTIFLLIDGVDQPTVLNPGQLVVVPQGTWHRFETPLAVKVLTVTPQPTDHQTERPT